MSDSMERDARIEARLREHAGRSDRPFDAAAIAATAVSSGRPTRPTLTWRWPTPVSMPLVLLLVLALLAALAAAAVLSGQPTRLLSDLVSPRVAPSLAEPSFAIVLPTPAATAAPPASSAPTSIPIADPHAVLVVNSRLSTSARDMCTTVDRISMDAGTRDRVVDCEARVRLRDDGSEAAVQGTTGIDFVNLRTGRTTSSLETGKNTFAIALSPSGQWVQWESCKDYSHGPCSVVISARDGSNRHALYEPENVGYIGFTEWAPDESLVTIPLGDGTVLVGNADGSDLHPAGTDDFKGLPEDATWLPDGSGYLYLSGPPTGSCVNFCVREQVDIWQQSLDGSPATKLTNVAPGDLVVAAAMSPDGQSVAFMKKHVDPALDVNEFSRQAQSQAAQLWIRDASGAVRLIDTPQLSAIDYGFGGGFYVLKWSPDSTRISITTWNGLAGSRSSLDTYIVPVDGSPVTVLKDARQAARSPDGAMIGVVHERGGLDLRENDPVPVRAVDIAARDGSGRHQVARLRGDGGYFVWAAN